MIRKPMSVCSMGCCCSYVSITSTMDQVRFELLKNHYDLILLDLQMPGWTDSK